MRNNPQVSNEIPSIRPRPSAALMWKSIRWLWWIEGSSKHNKYPLFIIILATLQPVHDCGVDSLVRCRAPVTTLFPSCCNVVKSYKSHLDCTVSTENEMEIQKCRGTEALKEASLVKKWHDQYRLDRAVNRAPGATQQQRCKDTVKLCKDKDKPSVFRQFYRSTSTFY